MYSERTIGHEIHGVNNLLARHFERQLKSVMDEDATVIHCRILRFIEKRAPEDVFQKDIEKKFDMAKSTVTGTLKLMEKKKLITREAVNYDDRLKKICLTEKGKYVNRTMMAGVIQAEEQIKKGISEEELNIFFDILERIKRNAETEI